MKSEWLTNLLLAILLGALVFLACQQVLISRRILERISMSNPAANELTTSWITGYNAQHQPIYWTVTTTRNSGESVTAWIDRHTQEIKDAVALHPPVEQ